MKNVRTKTTTKVAKEKINNVRNEERPSTACVKYYTIHETKYNIKLLSNAKRNDAQ